MANDHFQAARYWQTKVITADLIAIGGVITGNSLLLLGILVTLHGRAKRDSILREEIQAKVVKDDMTILSVRLDHLDKCIDRIDERANQMLDILTKAQTVIVDRMIQADSKIMDALNAVRAQVPPRSEMESKISQAETRVTDRMRDFNR